MFAKREDRNEEKVIQLNRLLDRKDLLLSATQRVEELRNEYFNNGEKDPEGKIETELYKNIYTIISCMSELIAYLISIGVKSTAMDTIIKFLSTYPPKVQTPLPLIKTKALYGLCLLANSLPAAWMLKKESLIKIENLDSLIDIKMFSS